ncbi:MAG: DNA mismatch repair protein MutS, partial [Clostridia bacterium]|nr:DNA mismatch repair protein MutS [Clostridia bacterium]
MSLKIIDKMHETLEFNKVLRLLEEQALSENARHRIRQLIPYLSEADINRHMNETTQARLILEQYGNPPLSPMNDLEKTLSSLGKGIFLLPEQLTGIAQFLTAGRRLKGYLRRAEATTAEVATYGNSIFELSDVEDEISRAVRGGMLDDRASAQLASIRRKLISAGDHVKSRMDSLLRNNPDWFSESFVSVRNGHYTLPVKRECKNRVAGTVIDISQSGGTCFIEPIAAAKLQQEISMLHIAEENEIRRILFALTALVEENLYAININVEAMETLDFIFAKAKLSVVMQAAPLPVKLERRIVIKGGRHPLLNAENIIPLDFEIGGDIKGVVITGPNTGGKTVALKTIGLLSMMAQSGLHVPATDGVFTMNNAVLCDIGDGQSIAENLSTFSSHITNIIDILRMADDQSLVLLDELGSGTDPAEGMGLAVSILEELTGKNCLFVATTHYPEIKDFAKSTPGLINARMAFDRRTLQPLYRLETGEAGESCALYIAKRLGMPLHMIERAAKAA